MALWSIAVRLTAFGWLWVYCRRVRKRVGALTLRPLFAACGRNVVFNPNDSFSFRSIRLGEDVFIGSGAIFSAQVGIDVGSHVMFGPNVVIMAGDHNTALGGRPMSLQREKRERDDLRVVIEDDVWIGANVVILKGVRVCRGSVVGAGSVVTRDVPPYAVVAGVPARVIRIRGTLPEIVEHEMTCYPEGSRLGIDELASNSDLTSR